MLKKILIILIVLLILIIGTLLVYNFFFKKEAGPITKTEEKPTQEEAAKPSPSTKIKAITQETVLAPTIDGQKLKYYLAENGNVFESNFDGSDLKRISSNILQSLKYILWSPDKTAVMSIFEQNGEIKKYFYNYKTRESSLLNQNIQGFAFSPQGDKIAYQYYNPQIDDNNISLANPDGSNWQSIFKIKIKDLVIEWPQKELISLRSRPSGLAPTVLYVLNPSTKEFQKILSDVYGFTLLWSPSGEKMLFSETDKEGRNLKLKIANKNGGILKELNILTLPEKCVFSQDERFIFCAVARIFPANAVLPDDYYKDSFSPNDDFYKIDLETNQKTFLIDIEQMEADYDANQPFLSPQEDYLFFVNKKDGLLYSLKL